MKHIFKLKHVLCFMLIVAISLPLISCSSSKNVDISKVKDTTTLQNINPVNTVTDINRLSGISSFTNTFSNSKGSYIIHSTLPNAEFENIFYLDFASNTYNYLCNNPECKHDNENCTSYLSPTYGVSSNILATENNLFIFSDKVTQMNLDGTNRKELLSINAGAQNSFETKVYGNDHYLFFFVNNYGNAPTSTLIQCNLDTAETKEIFKINKYCQLADMKNNALFFSCTQDIITLSSSSPREESQYINYLYKVDLSNPNLDNKIEMFKQYDAVIMMIDGVLYKCDYITNELTKHDYINDTLQTIPFEIPFKINNNQKLEVSFNTYEDGKLYTSFSSIDKYDMPPNTYISKYYRLDFDNAKLVEDNSLNKDFRYDASIIGETEDLFYLYLGTENTSEENFSYKYASIPKTDYYNGVKTYTMTKDLTK